MLLVLLAEDFSVCAAAVENSLSRCTCSVMF